MRKLITCLLSGVLVGSMLLTPASATTTSVISDDPSIDNSSVVPYASLCDECGIGQVRYNTKTEGPWIFNQYVECLSGDPQYRDKEYYRDVTKYYLCDHCGSGFGDAVRETKVEHEHGW